MPMSRDFEQRLYPKLRRIVEHFGTPFHIYDEPGIIETGKLLKRLFAGAKGFQEFFAVKALPNPRILAVMKKLGFGFDCSSIPELRWSRRIGAGPADIMFTSNDTTPQDFAEAALFGGCILNLDDISLIPKVPEPFPELICFRYNPGPLRTGNAIIGKPVEAKYGVRHDQIVEAYVRAQARGAKRFGLHTMVISNERDYAYMVETVRGLLEIIEMVQATLGIEIEFINMGGGLGTPYKPEDQPLDVESMASGVIALLHDFKKRRGYMPRLYMESGRYMTGPHGALVTTVINRMSKYREYVGVDACMSALMRPAIYDAYHHITVPEKEGGPRETVDVSGRICENCDKFAKERDLPVTVEGDILVIHNTGAHGLAMGFNYNGSTRPQELLLRTDGSVKLIRRAETFEDLDRTLYIDSNCLLF